MPQRRLGRIGRKQSGWMPRKGVAGRSPITFRPNFQNSSMGGSQGGGILLQRFQSPILSPIENSVSGLRGENPL